MTRKELRRLRVTGLLRGFYSMKLNFQTPYGFFSVAGPLAGNENFWHLGFLASYDVTEVQYFSK